MNLYYNFDLKIHLVKYCKLQNWDFVNMHTPYWRFYWNSRTGGLISRENSQPLEMSPDFFFLIPPELPLSSKCERCFSHLFIYFSVNRPFDNIQPNIYKFPVGPVSLPVIKKLCAELENKTNQLSVSLLAHSLIYNLLGAFTSTDFQQDKLIDGRIKSAIDIMNQSLASDSTYPTNCELAKKVHMSTSNFICLFSSETGFSPQKYLRTKRIEKASVMLHFSEAKIDDIAQETGFTDRYHFSKIFKAFTGQSPAEFRKTKPF